MTGLEQGSLWAFLVAGLTFGLAGGLSPGPLTALIIGQTVRFGLKEGLKVCLAPILTDGPLILGAAISLSVLSGSALAAISFVGAGFLVWLAWDSVRAAGIQVEAFANEEPGSIRKAITTNLLNPHPYLFWATVGGPVVVDALAVGHSALVVFLTGFFVAIMGAKVAIAWASARVRSLLMGSLYRWVMKGLALAMLFFAWAFVDKGITLLQ